MLSPLLCLAQCHAATFKPDHFAFERVALLELCLRTCSLSRHVADNKSRKAVNWKPRTLPENRVLEATFSKTFFLVANLVMHGRSYVSSLIN